MSNISETKNYQIPKRMRMILKHIYGSHASVTIITQIFGWKLGKTDFALLLTELCSQLKIISQFASNTETYNNSSVSFINDFSTYDWWARSNKKKKLFIFDEAAESAVARRAMSNLNVEWLKRIPQLSKDRCHLVILAQDIGDIDSCFKKWTFLRGIWKKTALDKVTFYNPFMFSGVEKTMGNIPKTSISFDPLLHATWNEKPTGNFVFKDDKKAKLWDWAANNQTSKQLGWNRKTLRDNLKAFIIFHLEQERYPLPIVTEGNKTIQQSNGKP